MTQPTRSGPTAGSASTPPDPRGGGRGRGGAAGFAAATLAGRSTPAALARLRAFAVVLVLALSVGSALVLVLGWQANRLAASDTEQLIRAQSIKTDLLRADAIATNAFLVGGLESASQRAAYDAALTSVTEQIAAAAQAQPADEAVLARLNTAVLDYASTMERARATNRQGLPVGSAYLQQASTDLRSTVLPLTDALVTANADRAVSSMGNQHPWVLVVLGLLALAGLGGVNRWIARRFRRRVNLGLLTAATAMLIAGVASVIVAGLRAQDNTMVRQTSYTTVVDGAAARTAANDAKSAESLRLIARGSGQGFEQDWKAAAATVGSELTTAGTSAERAAWTKYVKAHEEIVALDSSGNWDGAVAAATATTAGSATAEFTAFDQAMAKTVETAGTAATAALRSGGWIFLLVVALDVLLGLAAAAAAWRGVSTRLEEYT